MIVETYENPLAGLKAHVCLIRINASWHYSVDTYDLKERQFLPDVKIFASRQTAKACAQEKIGLKNQSK